MATQVFLQTTPTSAPYSFHTGNNDAKADTTNSAWTYFRAVKDTRGSGVTSVSANTVNGPTNGVEVVSGATAVAWISAPLAADVTISGTVTHNLWALENNMSANADIQMIVERVGPTGSILDVIDNSERNVELGTSAAANNWTSTANNITCQKGDRLRIRVLGNDQTTMVTGFTFTLDYNGTSAAADGDSYVTFNETFSFIETDPTGSQVFLTDVASDVSTSDVDREAWTSRGDGVNDDVVNTSAGFTAPIQWTDTAGGTTVSWFTKKLQAFTLTGAVLCNIRAKASNTGANIAMRCEVARVDSDGTNATVWAATTMNDELTLTETAYQFYLAGDDLAISNGQRLRIRLFVDDRDGAMEGARTATVYYDGTSGGASGDSYLTFTQTLSEFVAGKAPPVFHRSQRFLRRAS